MTGFNRVRRTAYDIESLAIWDRVLTAGAIATLNAPAVPEPATLLLLALGGAAAATGRSRRHWARP